jgi:hypothetical protein
MGFGSAVVGAAPITLGSATGIAAATAAPTVIADGFPTYNCRFVDLRIKITGGTSANFTVYLWDDLAANWILYTDVPETTLLTANAGGVIQIEPRTADRVYVRCTSVSGGVSVSVYALGMK